MPISILIKCTHKKNIKSSQQIASSQYETNVTYNCTEAMYSNSTEETKGSVKTVRYLTSVVCEILSSLVWACQAALPSIWMTLMKGERGNNQRSQYFTLDTDAYSSAAGRRNHLSVQLSSDLTLEFNATFLSPAHSSHFSLSLPQCLILPLHTSVHPTCLLDCI